MRTGRIRRTERFTMGANMNVSRKKEEIRRRQIERRRDLEAPRREKLSRRACTHVTSLEAFRTGGRVLFYYPLEKELDLRYCFEAARERGIKMVFPRVNPGTDRLDLHRVKDPEKQLREGAYQVMEPPPKSTYVEPRRIDLALVPGLAFDSRGNRIGFGKGYYDRLLGEFESSTVTAGVGYHFQLVEQVPVEEHDRPVQLVVTDEGVQNCD